jgi:hypothetical protein
VRVPQSRSEARLVSFYKARLLERGWTLAEQLDGSVMNFRKDQGVVSVNLESFRLGLVEIDVDYSGADSRRG